MADESQHLFAVAAALAAFAQSAGEAIGRSAAIGDADTADFFIEIYPDASPIRSASSNRKLASRYARTGRLRKDPAGKPDDSTKIATTPIATQHRCYWVGS